MTNMTFEKLNQMRDTTFDRFNEYKSIVDAGDTSSPSYWAARESYEDSLRVWDCMRESWQKRSAFAASMLPPYSFNVTEFQA